jgi:hypothetical protein
MEFTLPIGLTVHSLFALKKEMKKKSTKNTHKMLFLGEREACFFIFEKYITAVNAGRNGMLCCVS